MKTNWFSYSLAIVLLATLYILFSVSSMGSANKRLAIYYTPNGNVISVTGFDNSYAGVRLLYINGQSTLNFPAIFKEDNAVVVQSKEVGLEWLPSVAHDISRILLDFGAIIAASFLFLFTGIWFFHNTRDIHFVAINLILSIFCTCTVVVLVWHKFALFWELSSFLLFPAILNLGLRTTGRYVSGYLLMGEVVTVLSFVLLSHVSQNSYVAATVLYKFKSVSYVILICFVIILQLWHALRKPNKLSERIKRWVLWGGTLVGIALPFLFILLNINTILPQINLQSAVVLSFIFPPCLVYSTYRQQLIPFQIMVSRSLLFFLHGTFFACIYGLILFTGVFFPPHRMMDQSYWLMHGIFILTIIFLLDPLQRKIVLRWKARGFQNTQLLSNSLQKISQIITSYRNIQTAASAVLSEVESVLKLKKIDIMMAEDDFRNIHLRKHEIKRVPVDSPFWHYIQQYDIIITDYLTYGVGSRASLFHFLFENDYMLLIGIQTKHKSFLQKMKGSHLFKFTSRFISFLEEEPKDEKYEVFQAALLVGYPTQHRKLKTKEAHYLQEVGQYMNMLMQNYTILINEIEKRQRIRKLQSAAQVQRRLPQNLLKEVDGIEIALTNEAAVNVSGDYFELLPLSRNRLACFLGDVSGHGLGSGYLASSLQAILHSHLQNNATLSDTIQLLNHFLIERYQGDEFVTLIVFILDSQKREVEYFNAAHPSPYLYRQNPKPNLISLKNFQPVIGVLHNEYHTEKLKLDTGDRLFLYSDGVPETFDKQNIPFGEERLQEFVGKNIHLPPDEVISKLKQSLVKFRDGAPLADDTTAAVLEFSKEFSILDNILSLFRSYLP